MYQPKCQYYVDMPRSFVVIKVEGLKQVNELMVNLNESNFEL
jgi:hypothetical protein